MFGVCVDFVGRANYKDCILFLLNLLPFFNINFLSLFSICHIFRDGMVTNSEGNFTAVEQIFPVIRLLMQNPDYDSISLWAFFLSLQWWLTSLSMIFVKRKCSSIRLSIIDQQFSFFRTSCFRPGMICRLFRESFQCIIQNFPSEFSEVNLGSRDEKVVPS